MHSVVVSLLIVGILTCPYECAVKMVAAQESSGVKNSCCDQCRGRQAGRTQDGKPERDNPPVSDDDGVSCLCEGAVFDVTARQVVDDAILSFWNVACVGDSLQLPFLRLVRFLDARERGPSIAGGALVRILNQSFLL